MMKGSEILIKELRRHGVDIVFGYPGASILSLYDELSRSDIRHILPADERGAAFMANGYARATNKVGVCIATSGPGATNLVTGIADAFSDSVPLVVITGNVSVDMLGHDGFQEVDTTGITMPITKYNYIVKDVKDLSFAVSEAFYVATSGRKGPVLIDIPANVFDESCDYVPAKMSEKPADLVDMTEVADAAKIINESTRPLIYAGGGVIASGTKNLVTKLSRILKAPIGVSMRGVGVTDFDNEYFIGVSTARNTLAKAALKDADLLISVGARFSSKATEKTFYNKKLKLLHLDIDAAEIDKNHQSDARIVGDLSNTLPLLLSRVIEKDHAWFNAQPDKNERLSTVQCMINCLCCHFGRDAYVTTDVGQHQLYVTNYYDFSLGGRLITSAGLGAMGFGIGAAAGTAFATGKRVLYVTGDGSFNMSFNELITIRRYSLPVVTVIFDNSSLGMIYEIQKKKYGGNVVDSVLLDGVDYVRLANSFGIPAYRAETVRELDGILSSIDLNSPAVIDLKLKKQENIL